jgi:hypothetical protein
MYLLLAICLTVLDGAQPSPEAASFYSQLNTSEMVQLIEGRVLLHFVKPGMTKKEVEHLLGWSTSAFVSWHNTHQTCFYLEHTLFVEFIDGRVKRSGHTFP